MVTPQLVEEDAEFAALVNAANQQLAALGYTEHGQRHGRLVGHTAADILQKLGYSQRDAQLAHIAGYLHDIGNLIHRGAHALSGAMLAYQGLRRLGMPPEEVAVIMGAIGNHEEQDGIPVSPVAAAVVLADKADVHRSRVQNPDMEAFDIHDRVNYAATRSEIVVDSQNRVIALQLVIDTGYAQVMEYFEIFISRMVMMREAAHVLDCDYQLVINQVRLS
jgi:metal-dependent HD superfamily phosphatase/phosphodiesterase